MENITVFSNRLDESTGTVENVLEMKTKKTPWHLRFAPKAKGIVSFVQNLLSTLTQKEGVRGGQLSAFFQLAAAVVVGIGLFLAPMESVQAETKEVLTYSLISGVIVECFNDVIYYLSVSFHVFDTGSDYEVLADSNLGPQGLGRWDPFDDFNNSAYYAAQFWEFSFPFGDYISIKFENRADSSDWITLLLYISADPSAGTGEGRHAAAYVQHSYGRSYYVDVYCPRLILNVRRERE